MAWRDAAQTQLLVADANAGRVLLLDLALPAVPPVVLFSGLPSLYAVQAISLEAALDCPAALSGSFADGAVFPARAVEVTCPSRWPVVQLPQQINNPRWPEELGKGAAPNSNALLRQQGQHQSEQT
jgi:hypothetical protein